MLMNQVCRNLTALTISLFCLPLISQAQPPSTRALEAKVSIPNLKPALSGVARGLLVECSYKGIRLLPEYMDGCAENKDMYLFTQATASPVITWFSSTGQGFDFLNQWSPDGSFGYRADVARFNHTTQNSWGLQNIAHIAEIEVNGGRGCVDDKFEIIASRAGVLLEDSLVRPAEKLEAFLAPFTHPESESSIEEQKALTDELDHAIATDPEFKDFKKRPLRPTTHEGFVANWDDPKSQLILTYYSNHDYEARWRSLRVTEQGKLSIQNLGVEFARTQVYDARGMLVSDHSETARYVLPIRTEVMPPQHLDDFMHPPFPRH